MAKHFQLLSLLLTILFTTHSLSQPTQFLFNGFKHHTNLTLSGIAKIQSNGLIALTNHTSRLIGRAFYPTLIHFKPSPNGTVSSFSTSFAFAIVPEYSKLGGHGLAFVIGPDKYLENGLPSQYLGLLNPNTIGNFSKHLFAVEFDTVQDFEFKDINDNHVGIDLNDLKSNISVSAGYFMDGNNLSAQPLNLKSGDTILTWVDYDSEKTELNVTLSLSSMKPGLPILSVKIDLSLIFKEFMYVGFSSSTGLLASSHYLQGWSFNMNGQAQSLHLSSLPSLPGRKPVNTGLIIGVSLSALIFMVLAIGIVYYFTRKMKKDDVIEDWELEVGPHRFSYKELKKATRGFRDEELLGFGGFGKVYRGVLSGSDNEVAIKRISNESKQGLREFVSEIASIGRLRHRNLVQLLGWCRNKCELLLVYDFMPNGSLDKYLFEEPISILSWDERFRIIKCVASGLLYLHEEWEQTVIHRDIKAGNVLLDEDMNGRLGDFGLSKLYEHGSNPNTTKVVGTLGYLAPELTRTGRPTTNSDVFSFGALVLEVVCGRRPIEPKALPEELILVDWVWDRWRTGAIFEVVDKRLEGEYDDAEVVVATKIGLMCSSDVAEERPSMRQVFRYLEGERRLPEVLGASGGGGDGKKGGGGSAAQPEFEDFVHS